MDIKQQLVDAIRMLERAGYIDHNGHCSARRDENSFFINSGASVRGALTTDDLVTVDLAGVTDVDSTAVSALLAAACVRLTTFGTVTCGRPDDRTSATAVLMTTSAPAAGF